MIVSNVVGGLGNQLFQYALGRALSLKTGQPLKFDLREMDRYGRWKLQLDQFNIHLTRANNKELPLRPEDSFWSRMVKQLRPALPFQQIIERETVFDSSVLSAEGSVYLSGYWQSAKYFSAYADVIRSDLTLRQPLSRLRLGTNELIGAAATPVSVHVRRGDYVTNKKANLVHGTCEPEWYNASMHLMVNRLVSPTFFVFSDDPDWAKKNMPKIGEMYFVEPQFDGRDGEDIHLMAACHSHIIANSTFSWWGAWLNPRQDKHVIAPAQWFRSQAHDARDLVPEEWQRL